MEKDETISTPLVPQTDLKGKENSLERNQGNLKKSESSLLSVSKKRTLLETDENVSKQKVAQIERENYVTNGDSHYELNLISHVTQQTSKSPTQTKRLVEQGPITISPHQLQSQSKLEKNLDNSLKRTHSPTEPSSPSCSKKRLLQEKDETVLSQSKGKIEANINTSTQEKCDHLILETSTNILKNQLQNGESETEKEISLFEDNLKFDKQMIKRRRSSFGRYLLNNPSDSLKNQSLTTETTDVGCRQADTVSLESKEVLSGVSIQQNKETLLTKKYNEMLRNLISEYKGWKKLRQIRKQHIFEAEREVTEAKKKETLIEEEDILPHLTQEHKAILLSRPNYGQYLQENKLTMERLIMTRQKVEKVSLTYQTFVKGCEITSQNCYEIIEENILGEKQKDPKLLLKSLMNCGNSVT